MAIMKSKTPPKPSQTLLNYDGILGEKTWRVLLSTEEGESQYFINKNPVPTIEYPEPPKPQEPFICPCCGGNSYSMENGTVKCDYCNTKFTEVVERVRAKPDSPIVADLKSIRPAPLPTKITR